MRRENIAIIWGRNAKLGSFSFLVARMEYSKQPPLATSGYSFFFFCYKRMVLLVLSHDVRRLDTVRIYTV
jgi:hypothetical protein